MRFAREVSPALMGDGSGEEPTAHRSRYQERGKERRHPCEVVESKSRHAGRQPGAQRERNLPAAHRRPDE